MTPDLLQLLCDPETHEPLELADPTYDGSQNIIEGALRSPSGRSYPIVAGIPRFVEDSDQRATVAPFGDEWNHFNFTDFKEHWLQHTVANTYGSANVFADQVVVDAGAGSGAQALWMLQAGARHVIALELSHAVDGVLAANLSASGYSNYDIIQCTIDQPPFRPRSIVGMVLCHNVIQHTANVEDTAQRLFAIVGPGGEFDFNCYPVIDDGILRWIRFHLVYKPLRHVLARSRFGVILSYARLVGLVRMVPILGGLIEKAGLTMQGHVPMAGGGSLQHLRHRYRAAVLNTFDWYGAHTYQHHKRNEEIRELLLRLQPDESRVLNTDAYFQRPPPVGCLLRVLRD